MADSNSTVHPHSTFGFCLLRRVCAMAFTSSSPQMQGFLRSERCIPGSALPASNKSAILEFKVANVDEGFMRLHKFVKNWVKPPTNQPWGKRSFYLRDPDGNRIVNDGRNEASRWGYESFVPDERRRT